jgi:fatty-acid peroxygenase
MLDVYGTNHEPRCWGDPDTFRPKRFAGRAPDLFGFIPQGGGDAKFTHRCPGEQIAIDLMKVAIRFLTTEITYDLPPQDLQIDFGRMPALPRSGIIVTNVRPIVTASLTQ